MEGPIGAENLFNGLTKNERSTLNKKIYKNFDTFLFKIFDIQ